METLKVRYNVEHKSSRSKYYLVMKCLVTESSFERGGHYSPIETMSRPLSYDDAHAFCGRLNDEERGREKSGETAENIK